MNAYGKPAEIVCIVVSVMVFLFGAEFVYVIGPSTASVFILAEKGGSNPHCRYGKDEGLCYYNHLSRWSDLLLIRGYYEL